MNKWICTGENCQNCILDDCKRPTIKVYGDVEFININGRWYNSESAKVRKSLSDEYIECRHRDGTVYYRSAKSMDRDREYHRKKYAERQQAREQICKGAKY